LLLCFGNLYYYLLKAFIVLGWQNQIKILYNYLSEFERTQTGNCEKLLIKPIDQIR